jgi:hypothetical protein
MVVATLACAAGLLPIAIGGPELPGVGQASAQQATNGHLRVMNCFASVDRTRADEAYFQWYCEDFGDGLTFRVFDPERGGDRTFVTDEYGVILIEPLPTAGFSIQDEAPADELLEPFVACNVPVDVGGQTVEIPPLDAQTRLVCSWYRVPRRSEEAGGQPCVDGDPADGEIYLYAGIDFTDSCEAFLTGDSDLADNEPGFGVGDNAASSIKVGDGVRAMLCDQPKTGGACSILVVESSFACESGPAPPLGSYPDLGCANIGDDRVSSLAVIAYDDCAETQPHANEVILYSEPNYAGRCRFLGMGVHLDDLRGLALGNDGAASVRLGAGVGAILCAAPAFDRCEVFETGDARFSFDAAGQTRVLSAVTFPRSTD